jgi:flagellar basal body rod protein FlgC
MNVNATLSGINAAQTRLDVSAYNIANLSTQNFTRQVVTQSDSVNGGTSVTLTSSSAGPGNNLEADMVEQLQSKSTYLANLSVFKTKNEMMGALIDINT